MIVQERERVAQGQLGPFERRTALQRNVAIEGRRRVVFFNFNGIVLDVCQVTSGTSRCSARQFRSTPVIGAGSVVTRDVPERVFAAGNPCRVIREITE